MSAKASATSAETKKQVGVIARRPNQQLALGQRLAALMPNVEFVNVSKISDLAVPAAGLTELTSRGMPQYLSADRSYRIHVQNTKFVSDAALREQQYKVLDGEDSSVEDIVRELGNVETFRVIPERIANEGRAAMSEAKVKFLEAGDDKDAQIAALTEQRDIAIRYSALA